MALPRICIEQYTTPENPGICLLSVHISLVPIIDDPSNLPGQENSPFNYYAPFFLALPGWAPLLFDTETSFSYDHASSNAHSDLLTSCSCSDHYFLKYIFD